MKRLISRFLPESKFARNVSVLAGGTAAAQALTILALPIITRLYTPEDFSVLAVYTSLLSMLGVVACLRLEIAIPIPESEKEAADLFALSLIFTVLMALLVALVLLVLGERITGWLNLSELNPFLWLLPVGIWATGTYGAVQYWLTRKKDFGEIARTRMAQSVSSVAIQLLLGVIKLMPPLGLLLGQVASAGAGIARLGRLALKDLKKMNYRVVLSGLVTTFKTHQRFPKFSTIEAFANNANIQLPIIIIASVAVGPEAGFALLAMKAAAIPMSLIGSSVAQVYLSEAPRKMREGQLGEFTADIVCSLVKIGVGPLISIGILAPVLVPLIFGESWGRTGTMIAWMTPWFILQFLTSPISMSLHITGKQKVAMINQVWGGLLRVGFTLIGWIFFLNNIVELYALSGILFYAGYLYIALACAEVRISELIIKITTMGLYVLMWLPLPLILVYVL